MAETRRFYGDSAVYGNLAYDFSNPEVFSKFTLDEPVASIPEVEEQARPRVRTAERTHIHVAPFSIIGFALAGVLVIFMLTSYVQLTAVSDETVMIEKQINELKLQQDKLLIAYESAFNLAEIEEYALTELGMQKPRSDQIFYMDESSPDLVLVLNGEGTKNGFWDRFGDLLSSLGEYFRK